MSFVSKICFLRGLDGSITEREIREIFGRYGELVGVDLKADKGYGFVEYTHPASVDEAVRNENGRPLRGLILYVERKQRGAASMLDPHPAPFTGDASLSVLILQMLAQGCTPEVLSLQLGAQPVLNALALQVSSQF